MHSMSLVMWSSSKEPLTVLTDLVFSWGVTHFAAAGCCCFAGDLIIVVWKFLSLFQQSNVIFSLHSDLAQNFAVAAALVWMIIVNCCRAIWWPHEFAGAGVRLPWEISLALFRDLSARRLHCVQQHKTSVSTSWRWQSSSARFDCMSNQRESSSFLIWLQTFYLFLLDLSVSLFNVWKKRFSIVVI